MFELSLSNYATKSDVEIAACFASKVAKKDDLACLNSKVDEFDINELKTVSNNLNKPTDIVKYNIVKKTVQNKLVINVNAIDAKVPI